MRVTWVSRALAVHDGQTTSRFASSRYRALLPAAALRSRGIDAQAIGLETLESQDAQTRLGVSDIVVLQKLSPLPKSGTSVGVVVQDPSDMKEGFEAAASAMRRALALAPPHARIVFDINDDNFEIGEFVSFYRSMETRASGWIAATEFLAKRLRSVLGVSASVVPDPYEGAWSPPRAPVGRLARALQGWLTRIDRSGRNGARMGLLWFGHRLSLPALASATDELFRASEMMGIDLLCVTALDPEVQALMDALNRQGAHRLRARAAAWSPETLRDALRGCDAVLIPADLLNPRALAKSANRLLETLVAGRLAICHPVPAYVEFQHCAWIGEHLDDGLRWAIAHPGAALARIREGQRYVERRFSPATIASRWLEAFDRFSSAPRTSRYVPSHDTPLRLNLGCGDKLLSGYVNVDSSVRHGVRPDVIGDIRDLSRFPSGSAEEVLAVHVVEHFPAWEIEQALREWVRVLRPGGRLVIECPNIAYGCEQIAAEPGLASAHWSEASQMMWVLYGDPRWRDPLMGHRWGYTPESLVALLRSVGLVDVRQEPAQFKRREPRDMRVVGEVPEAHV